MPGSVLFVENCGLSQCSGHSRKNFEKNPWGSVAKSRKAVYNEHIMQNYVDLPRKGRAVWTIDKENT